MAKTYVQRIAEVVARKHNLSLKDAEEFVSTMFSTIHEGLESDKLVKIKGLGTFKVVGVKARESVNVNTGERLVIEGHDKVSFTPDKVMAELVNKPFAQFETVVLNDGVDLDAIDDAQPAEPSFTEPETIEQVENFSEKTEALPEKKVTLPEETEAPVEPKTEEKAEEPNSEILEDATKKEESTVEDNDDIIKEEDDAIEEEDEPNSHKRLWVLLVLGLLIIGAVAGYFWYNHVQTANQKIEKKESPLPSPAATDSTKEQSAAAQQQKASGDAKPSEETATDNELIQVNKDPRVRAGAYDIVAIDTTVVLRHGQTMQRYCHATLGDEMIVYFQALNGRDAMAEGDTMKVPKVKVRKRKANPAQ